MSARSPVSIDFPMARGRVARRFPQSDKLAVRLAEACTAGLRGRRADPTP